MAIDPPKKKTMVKISKPEADIDFTKKYTDAKDKMAKKVSTNPNDSVYDKVQGINIDKNSLKAAPKKFKRTVVKTGGERGTTRILSDDGSTVKYEGRSNMQSTKDALSQNDKQSADTNSRRSENANTYNINSGAKKELNEKDKARLIALSKATPKKK